MIDLHAPLQLLQSVAAKLTSLKLHLKHPWSSDASEVADEVHGLLRRRRTYFPQLVRLVLPFDIIPLTVFGMLSSIGPSLKHLHLTRDVGYSFIEIVDISRPVRKLGSLRIDHVDSGNAEALACLIRQHPSLASVSLLTTYGNRKRRWWAGVSSALRSAPNLGELEAHEDVIDFTVGGFAQLTRLTLRREAGDCTGADVQVRASVHMSIADKSQAEAHPGLPGLVTLRMVPARSRGVSSCYEKGLHGSSPKIQVGTEDAASIFAG
jgi:hypothetical protein